MDHCNHRTLAAENLSYKGRKRRRRREERETRGKAVGYLWGLKNKSPKGSTALPRYLEVNLLKPI